MCALTYRTTRWFEDFPIYILFFSIFLRSHHHFLYTPSHAPWAPSISFWHFLTPYLSSPLFLLPSDILIEASVQVWKKTHFPRRFFKKKGKKTLLRERAGKIAVCQLLWAFWTWTGGCPLLETEQILAASTHLGVYVCVFFFWVDVCVQAYCRRVEGCQ